MNDSVTKGYYMSGCKSCLYNTYLYNDLTKRKTKTKKNHKVCASSLIGDHIMHKKVHTNIKIEIQKKIKCNKGVNRVHNVNIIPPLSLSQIISQIYKYIVDK